jgi:tight adherence protein B
VLFLVLFSVFVGTVSLFLGAYAFVTRRQFAAAEFAQASLNGLPTILRDRSASELAVLDRLLKGKAFTAWLDRELVRADSVTNPGTFVLAMGIGAVSGALAGSVLGSGLALPLTLGGLAVPFVWLKRRQRRRLVAIEEQLPEALELITRSLKAGHPVPVAISMVAREMPDPIGTEFGVVADEVTYGSDLVTALHSLFERVGHEDLPLFVTAVSIQSSSGGNLREILDGLSSVIRERGKLKRKVRAISTEGRMSAYILTAVPALLMTGIQVLMPQFYDSVWGEPLTWYLLGGSFAWLMIGNAMMFKMSNFKF